MPPLRVIATASAIGLALALAACSRSIDAPAGTPSDAGTSSSTFDADVPDRPPVPAGQDGGLGIGLIDVPDTPCAPRGGTVVALLSDAGAPAFTALATVGPRRVAQAADGSGFLTFDPAGANVSATFGVPGVGHVAAVGGSLVFAGNAAGTSVIAQTYDSSGTALAGKVTLANEDGENVSVGASDTAALAVWSGPRGVRARGFAAGAAAGSAPYDLAYTSLAHDLTLGIAPASGDLFAVVFSGNDTGVSNQTAFARGTATARSGDPTNLFKGDVGRRVVGFARTPSGYALLMGVDDGTTPYAMLVLLDHGGRRASAGLKLLGTVDGTSLSVSGTEIGVLARRKEGQGANALFAVEFRPFDASGAPLGPWVCFEPPGADVDFGGAIAAEGTGYAAVFRTRDGNTSLARFDRLGTGSL